MGSRRNRPPGAVGGLNVLESAGGAVSIQLDARLLPGHDPEALVEAFKRQALAWVAQLGQGELELEISLERGDIEVSQSAPVPPKIDVRTRNGNIDLAFAPGAKFDLTASSNRGDVENEYGAPLTFESNKRGGALRGSNGGPSVSAHTERGRLTVRRATGGAAPAASPVGKQLKPIDQ